MILAGKLLIAEGSGRPRALCVAADGKELHRIKRLGENVKYDHGSGRLTGYRERVGRRTPRGDLRQG